MTGLLDQKSFGIGHFFARLSLCTKARDGIIHPVAVMFFSKSVFGRVMS